MQMYWSATADCLLANWLILFCHWKMDCVCAFLIHVTDIRITVLMAVAVESHLSDYGKPPVCLFMWLSENEACQKF